MAESAKEFKNVGTYPIELSDGSIVPVGEFMKLTIKEQQTESTANHIEQERLMPALTTADAAAVQDTREQKEQTSASEEKEGGNK